MSENYQTLAERPKIVLMNKNKISHRFDLNILDFKRSLETCIETLRNQQ